MFTTLSMALSKGPTYIIAKPHSKKNKLLWDHKKACFVVEITAKAEHNAANEAIERFLSKEVGVAIKITRGKTMPKKYIKKI